MLLSQLAIVFVGITGNHHAAIEHQLGPSLEKAGATELAIADADLGAVVHHTRASRDVVRKLHVDGVIAGEVVGSGNALSFRVVIYDGDGKLSSDSETPLTGHTLAKVDLDIFATNLKDTVDTIARQRHPVASRRTATDDDAPPGLGGSKPARANPPPPAVATTATAGDVDPVEAAAPPATIMREADHRAYGDARIHAGLTLGIVGRVLSSDPNTVKSYSSSPVGTAGFAVGAEPIRRLSLAADYERTLVMSSIVAGSSTASAISRWQVTASYDVVRGVVALAPVLGLGHRAFAIDSPSTTRTPDSDYTYLVIGATVTKPLGQRLALRGLAAFEPVTGATEPMMLGEGSRWGFDLGAALELRATSHVFARAAVDYQQFSSSWTAGSATDGYPTGSLAAGATF